MENERFERAARSRRMVALTVTVLFHLGLLAWVWMSEQQKANESAALPATSEQIAADQTIKP